MSRGAKCAKPEAMGVSEEPLNEREVKMATSLLARAVKFGQQRLILDGFIHQPGGLKPLAVIAECRHVRDGAQWQAWPRRSSR